MQDKRQIDSEITLKKIEVFDGFMETGSLGKTAEIMDMSTVSVHRALHSLEEGLGCPLFSHKGRLLAPLPTAKIFHEYCKEILEKVRTAVKSTREAGGVEQARIKLGTLYSLTIRTTPHLITATKLRRSDVEFDLIMGSNEFLLSQLDQNKLDVILIAVDPNKTLPRHLEVLPLFYDELFLAAPTSWNLPLEPINLKVMEETNFVTLAPGFATYDDFHTLFTLAGFKPKVVAEVRDIFSELSLVNAGVGVAILPKRMSAVFPETVRFTPLLPPCRKYQCISLVFKRSREHEPNILALVAEGRIFSRMLQNQENSPRKEI